MILLNECFIFVRKQRYFSGYMTKKVKLKVQGLTSSQVQSGAYALILAEADGPHRIPVIVGTSEAQSIAIALERLIPPRPLTHDLFVTLTHSFGILLQEVFIYKFEDGIFYSELVLFDGERQVRIDSRTSDAIAIALRLHIDIYTTEAIVSECGLILENSEDKDNKKNIDETQASYVDTELTPDSFDNQEELQEWLNVLSDKELSDKLSQAVSIENYEHAKVYQEELKKRKQEKE